MAPFAWQSSKAVLFYFTHNSISEIPLGTGVQRLRFWQQIQGKEWCRERLRGVNAGNDLEGKKQKLRLGDPGWQLTPVWGRGVGAEI